MYARLLTLTKQYQLAAQLVALPQRTVVKLTQAEWDELAADEQFAALYAGRNSVAINGVVVSVFTPAQRPVSNTTELSDKPNG